MDRFRGSGSRDGRHVGALRQVHHVAARRRFRAGVVQSLSVIDDVRGRRRALVAAPALYDAVSLELGHTADLGFPLPGRLRLPDGPARGRRHDFGGLDDPARFGGGVVRVRRPAFPRTQPAVQGRRPGLHPGRHGFPVAGVAIKSAAERAQFGIKSLSLREVCRY